MTHIEHITQWFERNFLFKGFRSRALPGQRIRYVLIWAFITLFGTALTAEDILVGGTLEEDQVWTSEFTYIVYKDLRIPEGITLTIQPGVTVKIDQGRGILVYGGNLSVNGIQDDVIDSVYMIPNRVNSRDGWKWKGISYTGSSGPGLNNISYTNIIDAETAVNIYNSDSITIQHSSFLNNQNIGVQLYNSRNCHITDCRFQNNYNGIEMLATDGNETSGNIISNCILKNENHNVYLLKAFGGIFINNLVENNLVEGGNNGIWMENGGGVSFGRNYIQKNIFVNNGSVVGYGLLISQDSVWVSHNLFWDNHIAIYFDPFTKGAMVNNNSFYQNKEGIMLSPGCLNNTFVNNTFSSNDLRSFNISETGGIVFNGNNIFRKPMQENIVLNKTPDDIDMSLNYWHVFSDAEIQQLIWDKNDDPALGLVNYIPHLANADTTNPVSPPLGVIKQWVDGEVKLSWLPNPEEDSRAYKIYYGHFENYAFAEYLETESIDTVIHLTGFSITDTIALTALDGSTNTQDAQVLGHESPFVFARIYPYAGPDASICKKQTEYTVTESNVPFEYEKLSWASNGDGTFNDTLLLNPVYFPGPADVMNGSVEITMDVWNNGDLLQDSFVLRIFEDPIAFAGNDTLIFNDMQLNLETAAAQYQESVQWISMGDGIFDNDTLLHPVYFPGIEDVASGAVNLVLMALSECGMAYDTLTLLLQPSFSVEGKLWHQGAEISDAVVLAVHEGGDATRAVEIAFPETDGYFRFDRLIEGGYYIYAVPDTLTPTEAVPGYYVNKMRWHGAYVFQVNADIYDVDITLSSLDFKLPVGEAMISGYFELPVLNPATEAVFCQSWFDTENTLDYCDGGLSNITVLLYNSSATKLLDFTLTDENGNFYFTGLPYGNYIVDAEKTGYQTVPSSLITLSPVHPIEQGVVIELTNEKLSVSRTDDYLVSNSIDVYPNPASRVLHIPLPAGTSAAANLSIYNAFGQLVMQRELVSESTEFRLEIDKLGSGIYFGRIADQANNAGFTFVKN